MADNKNVNSKPSSSRPYVRKKVESYFTIYANNVQLLVSPWDFRMVFGQVVQADPERLEVEEVGTIFMSPQHTKAFLEVLQKHVSLYEKRFGEIRARFEEPDESTKT